MAVTAIPLQPECRHRILPPGVTGLDIPAMLDASDFPRENPRGETPTECLIRLCRALFHPPERFILSWSLLDGVSCLCICGGAAASIEAAALARATGLPVFMNAGGVFAGEEGGLALLEELNCNGMVCDLGQSFLKISWAGHRSIFCRDRSLLPLCQSPSAHSVVEKGNQRRALRKFVADSIRTTLSEAAVGEPEGIIFALPCVVDRWGQPAGSSYIGMSMDTQLVTDAIPMAGLGNLPHWILNDAELAAASAIFDERIIRCGRALVFTMGTAVGCAVADPVAAARQFMESADAAAQLSFCSSAESVPPVPHEVSRMA